MNNFQFSQSSLQDYVDCARRFELRYIQRLLWPAVQSEPIAEYEKHMKQGSDFHHLIHQWNSGVPANVIAASIGEVELKQWWERHQNSTFVKNLPEQRHSELQLSTFVAENRLVAKYDMIAVGEKLLIVDWKTSRYKPKRQRLEAALQTRVYPYVLVRAGAYLNKGQPIQPEQVEMVYWFTAEPGKYEAFAYSQAQYKADEGYLAGLIAEIKAQTAFELTTDTSRCQFCTYRSLCERGIRAGHFDDLDLEDGLDLDFDFDQIAEVEF